MNVSHLESALDGTRLPAGQFHTVHQGRPLWVRYDLGAVSKQVSRDSFQARPPSLWRYRELLPLPADAEPVTLGEGMTPLLQCPRLGKELGLADLWIKDESRLPSGSFKSRGMTVAVSMAKHFGLKRLAIPTAGNAGGALALYGARAGMEVYVFMPEDTPRINQLEAALAGAKVYLVNGLITDCGKIVREGAEKTGWFDMSTLKEPYRLEGKKTMGLELAEQFDWKLPEIILYPTGGGTGLIGMWKAFKELQELGLLERKDEGGRMKDEKSRPASGSSFTPHPSSSVKLPRMIACQSDGCAPIVRAFEMNQRFAEPFPNAKTIASGLRVPAAVGDFMMLDVIRESGGLAVAGKESTIVTWMRRVTAAEGVAICPETAICFDVLAELRANGKIGENERVVVFNTGAAQKYPETLPLELPRVDRNCTIDYRQIVPA
jgi:threonine synthase